jgi:hypothetical protein
VYILNRFLRWFAQFVERAMKGRCFFKVEENKFGRIRLDCCAFLWHWTTIEHLNFCCLNTSLKTKFNYKRKVLQLVQQNTVLYDKTAVLLWHCFCFYKIYSWKWIQTALFIGWQNDWRLAVWLCRKMLLIYRWRYWKRNQLLYYGE